MKNMVLVEVKEALFQLYEKGRVAVFLGIENYADLAEIMFIDTLEKVLIPYGDLEVVKELTPSIIYYASENLTKLQLLVEK